MGKKRGLRRSKGSLGCESKLDPDPDLSKSKAGCSRESASSIPDPLVNVTEMEVNVTEIYDAQIKEVERQLKDLEGEIADARQRIAVLQKEARDIEERGKAFQSDPDLSKSKAGYSREFASSIPDHLEEGKAAINGQRRYINVSRELAQSIEGLANLIHKREVSEKKKRYLTEARKGLQSGLASIRDTVASIRDPIEGKQSDFELKKDKREVLAWLQALRPDVLKGLMDEATLRFSKKFSKVSSHDLVKLALKQFPLCIKPQNFDKIWILMKLAHNLIPKIFTLEEFMDLMKEESGVPSKYSAIKNKLPALSNSVLSTIAELRNLMKSAGYLFPKEISHKEFEDLIKLAHELFPTEFPPVPSSKTFTGMVANLERRESSVTDRDEINERLDLLELVATEFEWSKKWHMDTNGLSDADFGEQFFYLCKDVAHSNRVVFHKEPVIEVVMANAREGKYKAWGLNIGLALVGCFNSRNLTQSGKRAGPPAHRP